MSKIKTEMEKKIKWNWSREKSNIIVFLLCKFSHSYKLNITKSVISHHMFNISTECRRNEREKNQNNKNWYEKRNIKFLLHCERWEEKSLIQYFIKHFLSP